MEGCLSSLFIYIVKIYIISEAEFDGGDEGDDLQNGGDAADPHRPRIREGAEAAEREDIKRSTERRGAAQERENKREN